MPTFFHECILRSNLSRFYCILQGDLDDCNTVEQMEKYYETARSFDKEFPYSKRMPNCMTVKHVPHDYWTDSIYTQLNDSSQFELSVYLTSYFGTVCDLHYHIYFSGSTG